MFGAQQIKSSFDSGNYLILNKASHLPKMGKSNCDCTTSLLPPPVMLTIVFSNLFCFMPALSSTSLSVCWFALTLPKAIGCTNMQLNKIDCHSVISANRTSAPS